MEGRYHSLERSLTEQRQLLQEELDISNKRFVGVIILVPLQWVCQVIFVRIFSLVQLMKIPITMWLHFIGRTSVSFLLS